VNDLSVAGQYANPTAFRLALEPVLKLRARRPDLQKTLYCSRVFSNLPATPTLSVQQAIRETRDQLYIRLVLGWLAKAGPFWDGDRFSNPDDYFHFDLSDVTDQGLGEAARRILGGLEAGSFSFSDGSGKFERTPLNVVHGLPESPLGSADVPNLWTIEHLERSADSMPSTWRQMLETLAAKYDQLVLSPDILSHLEGYPFHTGIVHRIFALLRVLHLLAVETKDDQSFTSAGLELWQQHSVGDKAWFTDESERNKQIFKNEMTFWDPQANATCLCPWHGKIKPNQFRIHFEWPRPKGQKQIKVFYIGPKITKS